VKHTLTQRFFPLIFSFLLFSCSLAIKPTPPLSEEPNPRISAEWEKLTRRDYMQDTLKALARIEINSGFRRYPLKIALMLKRPSMMRIETIPVIGPTDFFLSLNNDTLKVFVPEKNKYYFARPANDTISLFFPISLTPEDLISVMMGIPPINDNNLTFKKSVAGKEYRIDLFSDNTRIKTLLLDWEDDGHLSGITILDRGEGILNTITYSDYRTVGEIDVPHRITVFSAEKKATITVRYSDVEFSKGDESFDLPIPRDVNPIILERGNQPALSPANGTGADVPVSK
jgi:hypothetical protein